MKLNKTIVAGFCAISLVAMGSLAAEGVTSTINSGSICSNQSSGALRITKACSTKEKLFATVPEIQSGIRSVAERHLVTNSVDSKGEREIFFPDCPTNAPVLVNTKFYIRDSAIYEFDDSRAVIYNKSDLSVAAKFFTGNSAVPEFHYPGAAGYFLFGRYGDTWYRPSNGTLDFYMISECAPILGAKTVKN